MEYDEVVNLRERSAAWRLLAADSAPLIVSFLSRVFVEEGLRDVSASALAGRLDDEIYALNDRLGDDTYPRAAGDYLDDWAHPERGGWLRKYYPLGRDEAHFEATPAAEKAIAFLDGLKERAFVGTASRLDTVFYLLEKMVVGSEDDPQLRLAELSRRRADIDAQIAAAERGHVEVISTFETRDLYQQFTQTARALLSDFREVEANLRQLDRSARERIAVFDGPKKDLLTEVFSGHSSIENSDQGRTFEAFYSFLLSPKRQEQLSNLLQKANELAPAEDVDPRIRRVKHDWFVAAERTQGIVRQLSEQLNRYLEDQMWLENRRVMDLVLAIQGAAIVLRDQPVAAESGLVLDSWSIDVALPMERPFVTHVAAQALNSSAIEMGDESFDAAALFEHEYVDTERLISVVQSTLASRSQLTLADLLDVQPLQRGLAEVVAYMGLDDETFDVVFDDSVVDEVGWVDAGGRRRVGRLPRVMFARATASPERE